MPVIMSYFVGIWLEPVSASSMPISTAPNAPPPLNARTLQMPDFTYMLDEY
jgi:hypothetical protein